MIPLNSSDTALSLPDPMGVRVSENSKRLEYSHGLELAKKAALVWIPAVYPDCFLK
jgi:hypothetical protein